MTRLPLCLILLLLPWQPAGVNAASDPARTEGDLARVREQIRALEKETRRDLAKRGQLDQQLRAAETEAARSRKELNATRRALAQAQRRLAELTRQLDTTREELVRQRNALAGQLRLAQITGGSEQVRAVFNQQDPAELGRRLTWLAYLARNRGELLGSVQASLDALERDRQAVAEQQTALAALEMQRRTQLAALENARGERATVVATLDDQVKGQKQELTRARTQAAGLQRLLRELERAAARAQREKPVPDGTSGTTAPGTPLGKGRWPVAGQLLADFGQSRAGGQMRWDGVLIGAPAGAEVRAVQAGKVVYADWLPGLGLLLVLDHGGGYLSLYGHNQDLTRQVGDRMAAGDLIAHVGDTGGQSRPALYFEVRRNGRPLNPRQWGN